MSPEKTSPVTFNYFHDLWLLVSHVSPSYRPSPVVAHAGWTYLHTRQCVKCLCQVLNTYQFLSRSLVKPNFSWISWGFMAEKKYLITYFRAGAECEADVVGGELWQIVRTSDTRIHTSTNRNALATYFQVNLNLFCCILAVQHSFSVAAYIAVYCSILACKKWCMIETDKWWVLGQQQVHA